jgi:hypothetical protein
MSSINEQTIRDRADSNPVRVTALTPMELTMMILQDRTSKDQSPDRGTAADVISTVIGKIQHPRFTEFTS